MLDQIINDVRSEKHLTPGNLADYRLRLAAEYGFMTDRLSKILQEKPKTWLEIRQRESIESDKMADRTWEASDLGLEETAIKMKLKSIEKIMSAILTRLHIYEQEAKNLF